MMRAPARIVSAGFFAMGLGLVFSGSASPRVGIPLVCSRGPSGQQHHVTVTVPAGAPQGSTFRVRIDGTDSGKISHTGLKYIFDMGYEWVVPAGTRYVENSARVVPGTGSENVRPGARATHEAGIVTMTLPAHVEDGTSYTPPSFEFELKVLAAPGAPIAQAFSRFRVTAHAFLVGDLQTICEPSPKPFPVGMTRVEPAATN